MDEEEFYNSGTTVYPREYQYYNGPYQDDQSPYEIAGVVNIPEVTVRDAEHDYYNPLKMEGISSGSSLLDMVYNNDWMFNTPVIGGLIKDKAKRIASQDSEPHRDPNNLSSAKGDYTGSWSENLDILNEYFLPNEKKTLPSSRYSAGSDYLEFLPSYSIKEGRFEEFLKEAADRGGQSSPTEFTKHFADIVLERTETSYEDFIKNKKPLYTTASESSNSEGDMDWSALAQKEEMENMTGVNFGSHKQSLGWDEDAGLPFFSISDAWDFEPNHYKDKWTNESTNYYGSVQKDKEIAYIQSYLMHKAGHPFKIYDRFYFDPETREYISDEEVQKRTKK